MKRSCLSLSALATLLTALCLAQGCASTGSAATQPGKDASSDLALVEAVKPALVRVEYTLKTDKGEEPQSSRLRQEESLSRFIEQERPAELAGYVISPTRVVSADPMIHPRFIEKIAVHVGNQLIEAKVADCGRDQKAVVLELAKPLTDVKPLTFNASAAGPYKSISYAFSDGTWGVVVQGVADTVVTTDDGRKFSPAPAEGLVVDKKGQAVGFCFRDELPLDGSWKGAPATWAVVTAAQRTAELDKLKTRSDSALLRVALSFRSPKAQASARPDAGDDGEEGTERNVVGVLLDSNTVLVLANMRPRTTARLKHISVYPPKGLPVTANFTATLKDYGAFVAKLEKPLTDSVILDTDPITATRDQNLLATELTLSGEQRTAYYGLTRTLGFDRGRKRELFPQMGGRDSTLFVFDLSGRLAALPIVLRQKAATETRWASRENPVLTPAAQLASALSDLKKNSDLNNVPLTEDEESRVAWLGVELQALTPELARSNHVADQTSDGHSGDMVTYIYPDSPAAKAGIEPGDILLRINAQDQPKPIEIASEPERFGGQPFPWNRYDEIPESVYERIPTPWPPTDNGFNITLTDIGFGKKYTLEYVRDGKMLTKPFDVVQSPTHYNTSAKFKSEPLGLTVRDLTFEVRRYFQLTPQSPGVIASKVEMGGKVAVAQIKPFEIITHVNNKPVMNVKEFEDAVHGGGELRFSVTRMTKGRIVSVKVPATTTQPAARSASATTAPAAKTGVAPSGE